MTRPWSLRDLMDPSKPDTFPYEHDTAILYHGASRAPFYDSEYTHDGARNPNSILSQGFYAAANGFADEYERELKLSKSFNLSKPGVYMGLPKTAALYAKNVMHNHNVPGIVMQVKVPTNILHTAFLRPNYTNENPVHGNYFYADGLDDMVIKQNLNGQGFEDVEQFKSFCREANSPSLGSFKQMHAEGQKLKSIIFAVEREIPFSLFDRKTALQHGHPEDIAGKNWVTGIWDLKKHPEPKFEDSRDYVQTLASREPEKLPDGIVSKSYFSQEEYQAFLETVEFYETELQRIHNDLTGIKEAIENSRPQNELVGMIQDYQKNIMVLQEKLGEVSGKEFEWQPSVKLERPEELLKFLQSSKEENLESFMMHLEDLRTRDPVKTVDYSEQEIKVHRELVSVLNTSVPDITPLVQALI